MNGRTNLKAWLVTGVFFLGLVAGQVSADPNLIAHYTFDNGDANDSSGNNHHGTIVPGDASTSISFVTDPERGKVLDVNNSAGVINSVVNCGGAGDWADIRREITIALWAKVDTFHVGNQYLLTKGNTYQLTRSGTTNAMRTYMQLDDTFLYSSATVNDGKWHHVAVTYDSDSSERIIYIDGQDSGSDTPSGLLNVHTASFVIGGRLDGTFNMRGWNGRLDDVRLYDRTLSRAEIRLLAGLDKLTKKELAEEKKQALRKRREAEPPEQSEFAAMDKRLEAMKKAGDSARVMVYPTRVGGDHTDQSSATRLSELLNEAKLCQATVAKTGPVLEGEGWPAEPKVLWLFARAARSYVRQHPADSDYVLFADYWVTPRKVIWAVHFVVCDRAGDWVIVDLQNSHKKDFQRINPKTLADCDRLVLERLKTHLR